MLKDFPCVEEKCGAKVAQQPKRHSGLDPESRILRLAGFRVKPGMTALVYVTWLSGLFHKSP
jgi:hypothetical protein